jgi:hypothetical protein
MKDISNVSGTIEKIMPFKPSTFETIDYALVSWVEDQMNVFCTTNKGFKKVPTVWVAGERSWQVKNDKNLRDSDGALIFPMITVQRDSINKNPQKKGVFYGNVPPVPDNKGGSVTIARRVNQEKTSNFLNADAYRKASKIAGNAGATGGQQINFPSKKKNKKIVYETITVPMPVYVEIKYVITARTEYQQQMNEILQPYIVNTGGINYKVLIGHDGHRYEAFMDQNFNVTNNLNQLGEEPRIYETQITVNVLGYLVGATANAKQPNIVIRENAVQVSIPRERTIFGDEPDWKNGKYEP